MLSWLATQAQMSRIIIRCAASYSGIRVSGTYTGTIRDLFDFSYNARYTMRVYQPIDFDQAQSSLERIEKHIRTLCSP